jgi:hypothetical protein
MSSPNSSDRARATLERLTSEAVRAENEWTALQALERARVRGRVDLLTVVYDALFNSAAARLMRLYDTQKDSAGLWYLLKLDNGLAVYFEHEGLTTKMMEHLSNMLKRPRDKVHMHYDKKYVGDPKLAWIESGLDDQRVSELVRNTPRALRAAYQARFGAPFAGVTYDAWDLPAILAALRSAPGVWHAPIHGGRA